MIELLGSSVVSSVMTAGLKEFVSLTRGRPSRAYSNSADRYARAYTDTRGVLVEKDKVGVANAGYQFQFNPQTVDDIKQTIWEARGYTGLNYQDYVWGGGGERHISFQLFLDNTPASKTRLFRPEKYNSTPAMEIKNKGKGFKYDESTGQLIGSNERSYIGKSLVEEFSSMGRTIGSSFNSQFRPGSKGPTGLEFQQVDKVGSAYSTTRVHERGILPEVELIQSFLYPQKLSGETTPRFAEGGIVSSTQFRPPATAILCIGPIYLEGHVTAAPVHYTLFDRDLTPIRATIDIEFAVMEIEELKNQAWSPKSDIAATGGLRTR